MNAVKNIILWLALALASFLPASALTVTAPETRVWQIFSIGYDATPTEGISLDNRVETSTSNYDTAPIHRAASSVPASTPASTTPMASTATKQFSMCG